MTPLQVLIALGELIWVSEPIELEVGGDGAIHTATLASFRVEDGRLVLSGEAR